MKPQTYNAKSRDIEDFRWCREKGMGVQLYDSYDGGGWNFYILEFTRFENLKTFVTERNASRDCWIEYADGKHERLEL